jgi:TRAP-type C4-dicarboxylate transport system substrate-binding protein
MKKRILAFTILFLFFLGLATSAIASEAKPIVLKAVTTAKVGSVSNDMFMKWIKTVNERAKGKLSIKFIGGPEAIPSFDQFEAVRTGVVDICRMKGSYIKPVVPEQYALILSQRTPWEEREIGYYDLMVKLLKEKANIMYLGRINYGMPFFLWLNKEVTNPHTDFKGFSMRSAVVYDPLYKALGVTPVTMEFTELYTGVERGIINGSGWPAHIVDHGWEKVLKYCVKHPFYNMDVQTVVNLDKWNKLPKHLQDLLASIAKEMEPEMHAYGNKFTEKKLQEAFAAGVKPIVFSPQDAKWYTETAYRVAWEEVKKKAPERYGMIKKMLMK